MTSILKVNNIQNSSGTSAMAIDGSGRVTTPAIPAFKVTRRNNGGSQAQLTGSDIFKTGQTNGQITVNYNIGSHFANGRFTCPVAGLYQFTVLGMISDASGNAAGGNYTFIAYFTKNGETNSDTIDNMNRVKGAKNIEVLSISSLMGEAIKRISNSNSVSDLFK